VNVSTFAPNLLDLQFEGPIAFLRLDDGKGNALGFAMLEAMAQALAEAESKAQVLVISGRERVFCGGLNLVELVSQDLAGLRRFMQLFDSVFRHLLSFKRPIVTVARGAAIAGGALLMCAGDDRLMAPHGDIGVTEAALGLNLPTSALELLRVALGERNATEAATWGRLYRDQDRVRVGFATEVLAPEALDARARQIATERLALDPAAVARIRARLRQPSLQRVEAHGAEDDALFLEQWFSQETQQRIRAVVDRLTKK
jgi:enoyl-CoA hydratase